ncbi:uncharacterized protein LOC142572443 isoform X2 [Dermacentor variabilis]|uniref:uncharacterized protein LOC142572443 isoform X2 n=1 Tax=Dermacentor variabilis TaxID=34621 RepID=UPI003F5B5E59
MTTGNSLAAGGPSVGAPIRHNLGKRAVPLPPASTVSVVPTEEKTNSEESTEVPMTESGTAATMSPTDGNTDSTVEQSTTPIEGTEPGATQTPSVETEVTSDVTETSSDISGTPSEATELTGSTLVTTETPLEVTSIGEISTTQPVETPTGTATPTPVQENNFTTGMETTAKPETKTPSMTDTADQTTFGDTTPQIPVSSSSPLTEIPATPPTPIATMPPTSSSTTPPTENPPTLPTQSPTTPSTQLPSTIPTSPPLPSTQSPTTLSTQRPSTIPTQSLPLPSTQRPTSYPTRRPSSQFPNLPYMPHPMLLPMGLDEFMGRIGVTKTSKQPVNLPSLSRPMSPMPLL